MKVLLALESGRGQGGRRLGKAAHRSRPGRPPARPERAAPPALDTCSRPSRPPGRAVGRETPGWPGSAYGSLEASSACHCGAAAPARPHSPAPGHRLRGEQEPNQAAVALGKARLGPGQPRRCSTAGRGRTARRRSPEGRGRRASRPLADGRFAQAGLHGGSCARAQEPGRAGAVTRPWISLEGNCVPPASPSANHSRERRLGPWLSGPVSRATLQQPESCRRPLPGQGPDPGEGVNQTTSMPTGNRRWG